jgi:hypothetical protein
MRRVLRGAGKGRAYAARYLPGYVFARFPGPPVAHAVAACPFVLGAVARSDGEWAALHPADLRALHAMRRIDAAQDAARQASKAARRRAMLLRPGDVALFRAGAMEGARCEVVRLTADGGAVVALRLFGGEVHAQARAVDLVPLRKAG